MAAETPSSPFLEGTMPDNPGETPDSRVNHPSRHDDAAMRYLTIGRIVCELMSSDRPINRQAICCKLLMRLEQTQCRDEEKIYHRLIRMLFGRQ